MSLPKLNKEYHLPDNFEESADNLGDGYNRWNFSEDLRTNIKDAFLVARTLYEREETLSDKEKDESVACFVDLIYKFTEVLNKDKLQRMEEDFYSQCQGEINTIYRRALETISRDKDVLDKKNREIDAKILKLDCLVAAATEAFEAHALTSKSHSIRSKAQKLFVEELFEGDDK